MQRPALLCHALGIFLPVVKFICNIVKFTLHLRKITHMENKKKILLLPHRYQAVGWVVAGVALLGMIATAFFNLELMQLLRYQISGVLLLFLGLFLVGFSQEKAEDEFTIHIRTSSALASLLIICALKILLGLLFVVLRMTEVIGEEDNDFVKDLIDLDFGSVFILYLILYKLRLRRYNRKAGHEE